MGNPHTAPFHVNKSMTLDANTTLRITHARPLEVRRRPVFQQWIPELYDLAVE